MIKVQIGEISDSSLTKVKSLLPQYSNAQLHKTDHVKEEDQDYVKEAKNEIKQDINHDDLDKVVEELNKQFKIFNVRMSFSYDEDKNITIIKVQDRKTGEIIKQIPPEEMLKSLTKISALVGIFVDQLA